MVNIERDNLEIINKNISHSCDYCNTDKGDYEICNIPDIPYSIVFCKECLEKSGWQLIPIENKEKWQYNQ